MNQQPNILFFFPDQHRHDWIGAEPDNAVRTPYLDKLAQNGVRFTNAVTPSPVCAPARACLASGMEYDYCAVPDNSYNYPLENWTFYQALQNVGYSVMGCGKFDLHKATSSWGIDGKGSIKDWGFTDGIDNAGKWDAVRSGAEKPKDPYMYYLYQEGLIDVHLGDMARRRSDKMATFPTDLPESAYCDNWIAQNGLNLLEQCSDSNPWFLQINFTGPHSPWDLTSRMKSTYAGFDFPPPYPTNRLVTDEINEVRQNYSAMIENIDRWLGIYINWLSERNQLDNTLIVFSSDHGEMLGDHDRWGKSLPYQSSIGVPLVIAGPNVKSGLVMDTPVSLIDLTATFLDQANSKIPAQLHGKTLRSVLSGSDHVHRQHVLSGLDNWRLVYDGHHKLVQGFEGQSWLFDLKNDPAETQNLFLDQPKLVEKLQAFLTYEFG